MACIGANQYVEVPITVTTTSVGKEHHTIAKCMCCHNRPIDTDILNVCIYTWLADNLRSPPGRPGRHLFHYWLQTLVCEGEQCCTLEPVCQPFHQWCPTDRDQTQCHPKSPLESPWSPSTTLPLYRWTQGRETQHIIYIQYDTHTHTCTRSSTYTHMHTLICIHTHAHAHLHTHMHTLTYTHTHSHMHMLIYTHTHTHVAIHRVSN